ncbi:MAG: hypothetical protein Q7S65_05820 [Nanoarchaeota archaeon]|nr:hypothetical protein [Nanoarchaeota archaeon]
MSFRAFSAWAVRSLVSLCLFSLLFALFASLDTESTVRTLFGDIYDHSSAASRERLDQEMRNSWCDENGPAECKTGDNRALLLAYTSKALAEQTLPSLSFKNSVLPLALASILLLIALFFIEKDHVLLTWHLGKMFLHLGISCLFAFSLGFFWGHLFPPDTTPIIDAVVNNQLTAESIRQSIFLLLPFILKEIFTIAFLFAGISFCVLWALLHSIAKHHLNARKQAMMQRPTTPPMRTTQPPAYRPYG